MEIASEVVRGDRTFAGLEDRADLGVDCVQLGLAEGAGAGRQRRRSASSFSSICTRIGTCLGVGLDQSRTWRRPSRSVVTVDSVVDVLDVEDLEARLGRAGRRGWGRGPGPCVRPLEDLPGRRLGVSAALGIGEDVELDLSGGRAR